MQQAILRASARLSPAAIRPVAPILHCRPLSSSAPAAALPVRRPAASQRRRDPARILTIPRREERSERPPRNAATGEVIVEMPEDREGVLRPTHAATQLLGQPGLVITRQLEIASVLVGFEQSNKYAITSLDGTPVGYLVEEESGMLGTVSRQALRTRRPFRAAVLDLAGKPILWVRRPFQLINSKIYVQSSEGVDPPLVGEAQQSWHLWRRRYDLFKARQRGGGLELDQFGAIDEGLWAWDFWAKDEEGRARASINRNFGGLGREIFTDTGAYVLRFDALAEELEAAADPNQTRTTPRAKAGEVEIVPELSHAQGLSLDERAVLLATAVSIDFDYFSRHSGHSSGFGFMPFFPFFGGGGGSELDPAQTEGPAPDTAPASPTHHDAPLPPGMMTGSIHDEIAREDGANDLGRLSAGFGPPDTQQSGPDQAVQGANWWDRDTLDNAGEGEDLLNDPWATGAGDEGSWGDSNSEWP